MVVGFQGSVILSPPSHWKPKLIQALCHTETNSDKRNTWEMSVNKADVFNTNAIVQSNTREMTKTPNNTLPIFMMNSTV